MPFENNNFVKSIELEFITDNPNESILTTLFREYEHVIFKSIITAFGLDIFIKDQYGGDVDTIHNVRSIGNDSRMQYKSSVNSKAYEQRGKYEHKQITGKGTNFQQIVSDARKKYYENPVNTVQDAYENKSLGFLGKSQGHPTDKSAELDHVIAGKSIHEDRGRVLAGLSTKELADVPNNLKWTNEHLNKSMQAKEIPDYIAAHPELPEDVKVRMMDTYIQAKDAYERKIAKSYYLDFSNPKCRQFYHEVATAAVKRGMQMGIKQAVGLLLTEFWFAVKEEIARSDGSVKGVLAAITNGLKRGMKNAKENYHILFLQFGEGLLSGVISSLTSTLCNVFFSTTENFEKILRQAWASMVEALGILFFNEREQYFCDRLTSATKVLATGAGIIMGTNVQEAVRVKLTKIIIPQELKEVIVTFAGCLSTGLLTITFLFYIDNNPFDRFLGEAYGKNINNLQEQGMRFKEYCAQLMEIDTIRLDYEASYIYDLSVKLYDIDSQVELNIAMKKALEDLKMPSLLGNYTLDEKMNDNKWVLTF